MILRLSQKPFVNGRFVTGFTLIELLAVTAIIVFLTALILPNYRSGDQQLALQRSSHKLAQDLRRTQEMAMSAAFSAETGGTVPAGGYGIQFKMSDPGQYILYGDADSNQDYGSGDYLMETIKFEKGIILSYLQTRTGPDPRQNLSITFFPPDPATYIADDPSQDWARITLAVEQEPSATAVIYINKSGLITIE